MTNLVRWMWHGTLLAAMPRCDGGDGGGSSSNSIRWRYVCMHQPFGQCVGSVCVYAPASQCRGQNKMQQLRKIITKAHNFIKRKSHRANEFSDFQNGWRWRWWRRWRWWQCAGDICGCVCKRFRWSGSKVIIRANFAKWDSEGGKIDRFRAIHQPSGIKRNERTNERINRIPFKY